MQYDVVIAGAGMVGQALACLLKQSLPELNIALIDPAPKILNLNDNYSSRVSAITLASQELLEALGVWQNIVRKQAFSTTKVWDKTTLGCLSFDADNEQNLGHIVDNNAVLVALNSLVITQNITYYQSTVKELVKDKQLSLATGELLSYQLLIGADGANSQVAKLHDIPYHRFDYAQKGIVALLTITADIDFKQSIYQWFTGEGIVALLPISDKECSLVWSCNNATAENLLTLNDDDFASKLSKTIGYHLGNLKLSNPRQAFGLQQKHAKNYVCPNLALVGDAAHSIHPLAGQGVNLGFLDVLSLVDCLTKARSKQKSLGNLRYLKRYQRQRQLDNLAMSNIMRGFYHLNSQNNPYFVNKLAGFGMNILNQYPAIKRHLVP